MNMASARLGTLLGIATLAACASKGTGAAWMPDASPSTCASPGGPTAGPPTDRCSLDDGGLTVQSVSAAACTSAGDAGTEEDTCAYGATLDGQSGEDDDCKYSVSWTSSPVCEGGNGVIFNVSAFLLGTTTPLTGAHTRIEYYVPSAGPDGAPRACDDSTTELGPTVAPSGGFYEMSEPSPGTYQGQIVFDRSAEWTVRFHFNEDCLDLSPASPHGHIAFHLNVP
jgi:hypothetical protein